MGLPLPDGIGNFTVGVDELVRVPPPDGTGVPPTDGLFEEIDELVGLPLLLLEETGEFAEDVKLVGDSLLGELAIGDALVDVPFAEGTGVPPFVGVPLLEDVDVPLPEGIGDFAVGIDELLVGVPLDGTGVPLDGLFK